MSISFKHTRTQRPVGQGLFHTGTIRAHDKTLRYVYDCGAVHKEPRDREIDDYLNRPEILGNGGAKEGIDMLFLSHFHSDHVNGVMDLVAGTGTRGVETVVMPYLSELQRLNIIISSVVSNPKIISEDGFANYINFMQGPSRWFREHGVRNIIVVHGTDDHEEGPETPHPDEPPDSELLLEVLRIKTDKQDKITPPKDAESGDTHITDKRPFTTEAMDRTGARYSLSWILWVFVPLNPSINEKLLINELIKEGVFKNTNEALNILKDASLIVKHMTKHGMQGKVVKGYENLVGRKKLNNTSMCLYSGPPPSIGQNNVRRCWDSSLIWNNYKYRWSSGQSLDNCSVGWIGTGDANFNVDNHMDQFERHYSSVKRFVGTITVPHHGSHKNFHPNLLSWARRFIISAGRDNSHGHPDRAVLTAIVNYDRDFFWVNEDHESALIEYIHLY